MPRILFILPFMFLAACNFHQAKQTRDSQELSSKDSISDIKKISQMNLTNSQDYRQILDMLDKNNLNSINVAVKLYKNAKVDSLSRDSMFADFNDFFALIANSYLENNDILQNKPLVKIADTTVNRLKSALSDYGMDLTTAEGEYYLEPETDWMLAKFGDNLSSAYREFLMISSTDQNEKFAEDGNILISQDSLISRIVTWENFIGKYPTFVSINKAVDYYTQYLEAFLTGTENTKVFDPVTRKLNENSRKAFEAYIQKNPGRKSSQIVKEYYNLLKTSDFLYTDKVDSFMLEKIYH
jgi:hypothetical protein